MQQLRIVVKPFKLEAVLKELKQDKDIIITHIEDVKGYTQTGRGRNVFYSSDDSISIEFLPKSYISIICSNEAKDRVVEKMENAARTAEVGDGKIFVVPVDRLIDIESADELTI